MGAQGTTTVNFGSAPGTNIVTAVVTGQTTILSTSQCEAWLMQAETATHNAYEHGVVPLQLRCGTVVVGTGFTITAITDWRLTGTFNVQWVWN